MIQLIPFRLHKRRFSTVGCGAYTLFAVGVDGSLLRGEIY